MEIKVNDRMRLLSTASGGARLSFVVLALAIALNLSACRDAPEAFSAAADSEPAGVLVMETRTVPGYKAVSAVLTNRDAGDARARIGGTLDRILVREGDAVRQGQLLAVIVDRRLSLEAQAGAAGVGAAEAAAERARADLARVRYLFERGVYAQARMDAAEAESRAADAQLNAARAQAEAADAFAGQGRITAPADGRVTSLPIPQGAIVMPGDIVVAISTGARILRVELPESEAAVLQPGQEIRLITDDDDVPRIVRIRQVYPAIRSGRVTADLDAADWAGDFLGARVRVLVPMGERRAYVIPGRYLLTRYGVDYVRLVREGRVIEAPVQRGARMPVEGIPGGVEILSGLRDGDRIAPVDPRS